MINVREYLSSREDEIEDVEPGPLVSPVLGQVTPQGNVFSALMRQENTVGSFFTNQMRKYHSHNAPMPGFKWYDNIPEGYLDYAKSFSKAQSIDDVNDIRFQIDLENRDKAIIGNKPISSFFTGFIVGALDPVNLLPGTAIFQGAKASLATSRMALNAGSAALVSTLAQEEILTDTQYSRTLEESSLNLLASTFIGSLIGAGAGAYINSATGKAVIKDVVKVMDDGQISPNAKVSDTGAGITYESFKQAESTVGAQFNPEINPEAEQLLMSERMRKIYGSSLGRLTPLTRGLTSPFASVRNTITQLLETNLLQKKNTSEFGYQEAPHALETIIRHDRLAADRIMSSYEDVFYEMNGFKKGETGRSIKHFLRKDQISWDDFERGAWLSVIKGDSDNAHFKRAGDILKNEIFDPWKEKMIEIGELPPNVTVKTAMGYFTRVYNIDKINDPRFHGRWNVDDPNTFYTRVKRHVLRTNDILKANAVELGEVKKSLARLQRENKKIKALTREYERLKSKQAQDEATSILKYSSIVQEGQEKINKYIDEMIDRARLTDREILELEEMLGEQKFILQSANEAAKGKQLHESDLSKYKTLESKLIKALNDKEKQLQALLEKLEELEEKPIQNKESIISLKEKIKGVEKLHNEKIKNAEKQLKDFSSSFEDEKIDAASAISSIEAQIKSAKKLKDIEYNLRDKSISERAKEFKKFLDREGDRIYAKRYRLRNLEEKLFVSDKELAAQGSKGKERKSVIEENEKQIKAIYDELERKYPPDILNSRGEIRKALDTDLEAQTAIENIIDNIRGLNDNRYNNPLLRGVTGLGSPDSTKNRHFLIPDEELGDFLVQSPSKVVPMFIRGVVPFYHIAQWAKKNGFDAPSEVVKHKFDTIMVEFKEALREAVPPEKKKKIDEEYRSRLEEAKDPNNPFTWTDAYRAVHDEYTQALKEAADPKYAAWLTKRFKEAEGDINDSLSILMGTYGQGDNIMDNTMSRIAKNMSAWNFIRMMGYMVISSLTDPGQIISRHGIGRFVSDGIKPVVQGLQAAKHNKSLLKDIGRACEAYNGYRLKSFMDQEGLANETGLFGKTFHYATQGFNNLSLMSHWTDAMQYIAGNVSISRTLRAIDKYMAGNASDKEIERLVSLGIKKEEFNKIHEQFLLHGGQEEGSYFINWAEWDTNSAEGLKTLNSFKYALLKDVDQTIIMPTIGDKPLFSKTVLGSLLFQFKSFAFAATNKLLISGMQRQDAEFAQGVMSLIAMGGITYATSRLLKNQEITDDPLQFAYEAIDRSGLLGVLMEVPLTLQKVGLMPGLGTSRYSSRGWLGALGGPTLGTVEDITYLLNRFKNAGETPLTDRDSDKILKLMPGNNIWYLDAINRNLGLTKSLSHELGFEETE